MGHERGPESVRSAKITVSTKIAVLMDGKGLQRIEHPIFLK
jgi:hypothetical protein